MDLNLEDVANLTITDQKEFAEFVEKLFKTFKQDEHFPIHIFTFPITNSLLNCPNFVHVFIEKLKELRELIWGLDMKPIVRTHLTLSFFEVMYRLMLRGFRKELIFLLAKEVLRNLALEYNISEFWKKRVYAVLDYVLDYVDDDNRETLLSFLLPPWRIRYRLNGSVNEKNISEYRSAFIIYPKVFIEIQDHPNFPEILVKIITEFKNKKSDYSENMAYIMKEIKSETFRKIINRLKDIDVKEVKDMVPLDKFLFYLVGKIDEPFLETVLKKGFFTEKEKEEFLEHIAGIMPHLSEKEMNKIISECKKFVNSKYSSVLLNNQATFRHAKLALKLLETWIIRKYVGKPTYKLEKPKVILNSTIVKGLNEDLLFELISVCASREGLKYFSFTNKALDYIRLNGLKIVINNNWRKKEFEKFLDCVKNEPEYVENFSCLTQENLF